MASRPAPCDDSEIVNAAPEAAIRIAPSTARARMAYRRACAYADVPLHVGLFVLLAFFVTQWWVLLTIGIFVILGGVLCALVGVAELLTYWRSAPALPDFTPAHRRRAATAIVLRVARNFGAVLFVLAMVNYVEMGYAARVHNSTDEPAHAVRFVERGVHLGALEPGRRILVVGRRYQRIRWTHAERRRTVMLRPYETGWAAVDVGRRE